MVENENDVISSQDSEEETEQTSEAVPEEAEEKEITETAQDALAEENSDGENSDKEDSDKEGSDKEGSEEGSQESQKEEADDADTGSDDSSKSWSEKRAAKKQAKKEIDGYKDKINELEDRSKRQLAEFENFRRRSEKEKQAMFETGARSVIEKMLPIIDNFERGLASVPDDRKDDPFVEGMTRVYKQLVSEMEKIDVKPIEALGKEFDPAVHNAVMQVKSDEYEPGVVAQELQKGYTYRDNVIRHSMVAVVSDEDDDE